MATPETAGATRVLMTGLCAIVTLLTACINYNTCVVHISYEMFSTCSQFTSWLIGDFGMGIGKGQEKENLDNRYRMVADWRLVLSCRPIFPSVNLI